MKSVVICGSKRFREEILSFADKLAEMGVVVYEPSFRWLEKWTEEEWAKLSDDIKKAVVMGLTYQHYRKIDLADAVFVFNRDRYIGNSVNLEIGYATAKGKPIYALESDEDLGRHFLFTKLAPFPERLAEILGYSMVNQSKKKIFICGSMHFAKEMIEAQKKLKELGCVAEVPCDTQEFANNHEMTTDNHEDNYKWCIDNDIIRKCFDFIAESDAVLLLNYPKNGINGYIGASGLMETGLAYYLKKKIFLLYPPPSPKDVKSSHEILIMQPTILNGDLSKISI